VWKKEKKIIAEEGQPQRNGRNGFLMKGWALAPQHL
jgi:hypothetical protein